LAIFLRAIGFCADWICHNFCRVLNLEMTAKVLDMQAEIEKLRIELEEAQGTLDAIRNGEVDAVVMRDGNQQRVYTLEGAEQPYRLLIEAMEQGAATLTQDGTLLFCNRSFATMMGQPQEQLIGANVDRLFAPHTPSLQSSLRADGVYRSPCELAIEKPDGGRLLVSASVGLLKLPNVTAYFLVLSDLTEHKLHEELKETDRRKDEFLAMLAHELRNPLAPISSAIEMLCISNGGKDSTVRLTCDIVRRQTHQLTRIVDDLLDVSRITRGVVALQRAPINVALLMEAAIEASRPLIDGQRHRLEVELPQEELCVNGDSARLSQVLTNVLNNAAKYTDKGGNIWVRVSREQKEVVLSIRDSGIGVAPELLPKVFDIFTQSERSIDRSLGGLGIGLTIARSIVELHGGRIEARSDGLGTGSEFLIHLPLLQQKAETIRERAAHVPASARRVLVVDDNRDAADGMAMLLGIAGQETRTAYDGHAALKAFEEFEPDLVLLDIGLPGMDGYAVAKHLRQKQISRRVVLAALTGYGDEEDRRRSLEAGFDYHYVKPVDFQVLNSVLAQLG
jgi:PAS domain S-box-containing protein